MSAPEPPSDSDPRAPAAPPAPRKRPWGWITLAGLLAACVVGLGIYAVSLNSDLDDANAKIASQQAQIDKAQDSGVAAAARTAYDALSTKLGAAQEDASQAVEQASDTLNQAEQAAADAKGTAEELQKETDAARAKAETAATCAQSFVSAFSEVFSAPTLNEGVQATVKELQALQPQCASALERAGSGS